MTKQIRLADGGLRIILPGTWASIPLSDEESTTAYVKRLVKRQVGTADRLARMRRSAVEEIVGTAREAVRAGVHTYLTALEILPNVPFAAVMMLLDIDWPDTAGPAREGGDTEEALTAAFPGAEIAELRYGPVARRWELANQQLGEDGSVIQTLRLEYFVPYPYEGSDKLLMVRVNVPEVPSAEPFAVLFNEIVDSISFPEELPEADGAAEPVSEPVATAGG
ncbi:hypothetical protein ACFQBY_07340 [Promicromonospora citrea]|uniref:Uncharacterized protein n=1 Tax=Promicromonospora citrea TaxID=43677 RepID=A0A8H9GM85_9MICO|nr:hypothetical protein [Promicromonospora citrea]NNH51338.1 hypothetical protein [Promicromonospora citrea]GGM33746.1 hypothetical protein GCM10010102_31650 [Promicromonospora citrea]